MPDDEVGGPIYKKHYIEPMAAGAKVWICEGKLVEPQRDAEILSIDALLAGAVATKC
jgi:hypothetical protein